MDRTVGIRLSLYGQDVVGTGMRKVGDDGHAAMRKITDGSKPASSGLLALNAASLEVQNGLSGLSGRAGAVGNVLSSIGPGGLVAAAGIGAVVAGVNAAVERSRQAVESFADVAKASDRLGVATSRLQELRFASERVGIGAESADEALKELGIRAAEAAQGSGEGAEGFRQLGISQDEVKAKLKDLPGLFELTADRISQLKSSAEQAYIADKIFGDQGGEKLVALLKQGAEGLARFRVEAHRLGVVVEEDVLRRATTTHAELQTLSSVIEVNLNRAFVDLAPVIVAGTKLLVDFAAAIRDIADASRDLPDQSTKLIEREIATLQRQIGYWKKQDEEYPDWLANIFGNNLDEIAAAEARIKVLMGELDRRAKTQPPATPSPRKPWDGNSSDEYVGEDGDPVKDAKATFKRAVQSFEFESDRWDRERATRESLDQTARDLMEYATKLREPQRKMLEDQAADVKRLVEANTRAYTQQIMQVGTAIDRSLQDNLSKSASGFQSWGDGVKAIIADVAQELIRFYMIQQSGNSLGGWIAQGINAFAGSLSGGTTPGTSMSGNTSGAGYFGARDFGGLTTAGGPRAAGGQVFPGSIYLTNERRAEDTSTPGWFMPVRPGVISPDSSGGGSGGAVVNQTFNLTSNGQGSEVQQLRAMMLEMMTTFDQRVVAAVTQARRTGQLRGA